MLAACGTTLFWEPRVYRGGARWKVTDKKGLLNIAVFMAQQPGSASIGQILLRMARSLLLIPEGKRPNPVYATGPAPAARALYELKESAARTATESGPSSATGAPARSLAAPAGSALRLAGASGGAAATGDGELIVFVNGSAVLASVMHAAAAAGAEHPQGLKPEHHKAVSQTAIERPSSIAGDGQGGVGGGGGGSERSRRTASSKPANGAAQLRTVCEVDSPESDALFVHKFFCTYCDRGATWKREDREQLGLEKALKLAVHSKQAATGTISAAPDTFRIIYPMQHAVDHVCAK
jgi:hypothetical protein